MNRSAPRRGDSRSRSPSKGRDKSKTPLKQRKKNMKGHKPSDWSKEELMDKLRKFAVFNVDRMTGSGVMEIKNKRFMSEDLEVIRETITRYTEVQHITLEKCFLTDELFATLISEFKNLRHLKSLIAPYNMLTSASVSLIIESYGASSRRIEVLDFRDNVGVTEDDGRRLFVVFSPIIKTLNGIDIFEIKRERAALLDVSNLRLKAPEMNIVIGLWGLLGNTVVELNLSKNLFDHKALLLFANYLKTMKRVTTVDLSFNPLTGLQGNNMTGIKALVATIRTISHIESVTLTATRVPLESVQAINRSLEVNRTLLIATKPLFLQHANALIRRNASPPRVNGLKDWKPKFAVDVVFSKINRIAERDVNVKPNDTNHDINLYLIEDNRKRNTDF